MEEKSLSVLGMMTWSNWSIIYHRLLHENKRTFHYFLPRGIKKFTKKVQLQNSSLKNYDHFRQLSLSFMKM